MPQHRFQSVSAARTPRELDGYQVRSVWRRRYTLCLILFLLLPGIISAPVTLLLLRCWLRSFHRWHWRRLLRTALTGKQHLRTLQREPGYALTKVRHQAVATICQLLMALVPARVAVGTLRTTQPDGEAILAICTVMQIAEVFLIAAVMLSFVRSVHRQHERLAARQAANSAR